MAYSHGFTPHPKISFIGAAPTGAASEAEYLEISLTAHRDPEQVRSALDGVLPPGLDIVQVTAVDPDDKGSLADHLLASSWLIELPGADTDDVRAAVEALMAADSVEVERLTKKGVRTLDARGAVLRAAVTEEQPAAPVVADPGSADRPETTTVPALRCVIEHQAPTIRPEEILAGLRAVTGFTPPSPPRVTRLAQGVWDADREQLTTP